MILAPVARALALAVEAASLCDGCTIPQPRWGSYAVPATVSYVAVMQLDVDGAQTGAKQVTIAQSGRWHRETFMRSGEPVITIVDLNSGRSLQYNEPRRGKTPALTIGGSAGLQRTTIQRTDRLERALGEVCRVWIFQTGNIIKTGCFTDDGIPLWHKWLVNGDVMDAAHAISITRRPISDAEVAPPSWTLSLDTWGKQLQPASDAVPNDKVLLSSCPTAETTCATKLEVRRLGAFFASTSISPNGQSESFIGPAVSLLIERTASGGLRSLNIWPTSKESPLEPKETKKPPTRERKYAGERCAVVSSSNVPDASVWECRSYDGILLARVRGGWTHQSLEAKTVIRGQTERRDVLPDSDVLRQD